MGPSQICGCPFREPRVFTIAHIYICTYIGRSTDTYVCALMRADYIYIFIYLFIKHLQLQNMLRHVEAVLHGSFPRSPHPPHPPPTPEVARRGTFKPAIPRLEITC